MLWAKGAGGRGSGNRGLGSVLSLLFHAGRAPLFHLDSPSAPRQNLRRRPPWVPLSRSYFAVPSPKNNQNEQFFYFTSLVRNPLPLPLSLLPWQLDHPPTHLPTVADPGHLRFHHLQLPTKLSFPSPSAVPDPTPLFLSTTGCVAPQPGRPQVCHPRAV